MHILVIEDCSETADFIAKGLREIGHQVSLAKTGPAGLEMATSCGPDLLIVDRMLPNLDGLSVVKALRSGGFRFPVLFLTSLGSVESRVEGFDAGGDDYLLKPFAFAELKARVTALLNRPPLRNEPVEYQVADLKLDRLKREVTRDGELIPLKPKEFQLLEFLMQHMDQVVTRTMLLEGVWEFHFDPGTNLVDSHISRLRAKIDHGKSLQLIKTIRGAGYRIGNP